eukprot:g58197.t1
MNQVLRVWLRWCLPLGKELQRLRLPLPTARAVCHAHLCTCVSAQGGTALVLAREQNETETAALLEKYEQAGPELCEAAKEGKAVEVQRLLEEGVQVHVPDQTGVSAVDLLVSPPYWQAHTARAAPPKLSKFAAPLHYLTSLQDKDLKDAGSKVAKEELKLSEANYAKLPVALCHSMLPWIEIKSKQVRDDRGLTALEALRQSLLPALRKWARSLGAFLGRYLRDAEPSCHGA